MDEVRLIDANVAADNADRRYDEWNLAMAAAEGSRQISMVYKKQELFKAVRKVVDSCPTIDPESLRPVTKFVPVDPESDVEWECIKCGCVISTDWDGIDDFAFCPCCGARIGG